MILCQRMIISYQNSIYVPTEIFHNHTVQNMKLLQELVDYKWLNIEKKKLQRRNNLLHHSTVSYSMPARAANNRYQL